MEIFSSKSGNFTDILVEFVPWSRICVPQRAPTFLRAVVQGPPFLSKMYGENTNENSISPKYGNIIYQTHRIVETVDVTTASERENACFKR